jgi:hypothetical protein
MRIGISIGLLLLSLNLFAQDYPLISGSYKDTPFAEVLLDIEDQANINFYYEQSWLDSLEYTGSFSELRLDSALLRITSETLLEFFIQLPNVYLTSGIKIVDNPPLLISYQDRSNAQPTVPEQLSGLLFSRDYKNDNPGERKNKIVEIGNRKDMVVPGSATIAGYIKDASTKEPLYGVVVYTENPTRTTVSDESGFYSIRLPNGRKSLIFQYLGMQSVKQDIVLFSDGQLNVEMEVDVISLREVLIESAPDANVMDVQMGVSRISAAATNNVPIALGERDIMKIATTTAGVQSVGEGSAGYNVRGGKSDQNLVLLNDATIYNASHFFGFFSVFNSDAIQDMVVYKSAIPARYGGRLSSVFDITAKKADENKFTGSGGISPVTAKLALRIPIVKDKAGLMIAGRTTYSNWLLQQIDNANFSENRVFFADAILRYDHKINSKNDLLVSGYYSNDKFRVASDTVFSYSNFSYENANASLKWTHRFSPDLEGVFTGVASNYKYNLFSEQSPPNAFDQDFGISDISIDGNISYYLDERYTLRGGLKLANYKINPGTKTARGDESIVEEKLLEEEQGFEATAYMSGEITINPNLSVYGGIRLNFFTNYGPQTVYQYEPGGPKNPSTQIDSIRYDKNELIKSYFGPEIRVNARYSISDFQSIKASYGRTRQNIHTLSNNTSLSPTDVWRLSSTYLKPQIADQFSIGYYHNFFQNKIETSAEVYYKDLQNLIDFKIGSRFLLNDKIETVALQGPGRAYGFEVSVKKKGDLNGWVNYAYARTFIKLDGQFPEETINNGSYYPTNYDMPHTINLVMNYKITKRISLSYNFTYRSGRPLTIPVGIYNYKGSSAIHYADRNSQRIPDYIRMDIGFSVEAGHKIKKLAHSYWSFSVYNLLGRDNPYSVYFNIDNGEVKGYQLVIFGNPIPTISYNFRF